MVVAQGGMWLWHKWDVVVAQMGNMVVVIGCGTRGCSAKGNHGYGTTWLL